MVNYTTKTQYLYRISKQCLDLSDDKSVNEPVPDEERAIPFSNFIYVGDSETDIPAMRVVTKNGGCSIGVYNEAECNLGHVISLKRSERINCFAPANYEKDENLERIVKKTISKIAVEKELIDYDNGQKRIIERVFDEIDYLFKFYSANLSYESRGLITDEMLATVKSNILKTLEDMKDWDCIKVVDCVISRDARKFIDSKIKELDSL